MREMLVGAVVGALCVLAFFTGIMWGLRRFVTSLERDWMTA